MLSTTAGEKDSRVAKLYQNIGHVRRKMKQYEEAEKNFKKSLTIFKDNYDPNHPAVLEASKHVAAAIRRSSSSRVNDSSYSGDGSESPRRSSFFSKFTDKFLKKKSSSAKAERRSSDNFANVAKSVM